MLYVMADLSLFGFLNDRQEFISGGRLKVMKNEIVQLKLFLN